MYFLTVASGGAKGQSWRLGDDPMQIGRSTACSVRVPDPLVSRIHCRIELRDGRPYFNDISNSNPALVNGEPLREGFLEPGDEVLLGSTLMVVSGEAAEAVLHRAEPDLETLQSQEKTESIFLASRFESDLHAAGQVSVHEIAHLFSISREFSGCSSESTLITRALDELVRFCAPHYAAFCEPAPSTSGPAVVEYRGTLNKISIARIFTKIPKRDSLTAHLLSGPADTAILVVPVEAAGHFFGHLVAQSGRNAHWHNRHVLDYALALADVLAPFLGTVARVRRVERENAALRRADQADAEIIGESTSIRKLLRDVEQVAPAELNVLVLGETGTGKELVARLIHNLSERRAGPFVAFNCAALPEELVESELFGHERGAFTGATDAKPGLVEIANGGTLVLDEVADLSPASQAKLLRVLESRMFRRVGATQEQSSDFRLIAMTSRHLPESIQGNTFRLDLYHRLNAVELYVPPLRERREDIPLLADYFFNKFRNSAQRPLTGFSHEAVATMSGHDWPGNVRELKNCVERAVALAPGPLIEAEDISISKLGSRTHGGKPSCATSLAEIERDHILKIFDACNGDADAASRMLGIGRSTLYNKLKLYRGNVHTAADS